MRYTKDSSTLGKPLTQKSLTDEIVVHISSLNGNYNSIKLEPSIIPAINGTSRASTQLRSMLNDVLNEYDELKKEKERKSHTSSKCIQTDYDEDNDPEILKQKLQDVTTKLEDKCVKNFELTAAIQKMQDLSIKQESEMKNLQDEYEHIYSKYYQAQKQAKDAQNENEKLKQAWKEKKSQMHQALDNLANSNNQLQQEVSSKNETIAHLQRDFENLKFEYEAEKKKTEAFSSFYENFKVLAKKADEVQQVVEDESENEPPKSSRRSSTGNTPSQKRRRRSDKW